jgi:hypothetical protein
MNFNHRLRQLLLLSLITWASGAIAATLFSDALNDLTKYFKAASALLLQASIGLENAKFDTLPIAQRNAAKSQLQTLKDRLDLIFREQTTLVNQFEFFVKISRDPSKTPAERKTYWDNSVLPRIGTVSEAVRQVRTFSDKPGQPFSIALSTDDRLALGDTLAARGAALNTFENMGPPLSSGEVLQFEGLIDHYKVLMENLFKLRGAIDDALRHLSSA